MNYRLFTYISIASVVLFGACKNDDGKGELAHHHHQHEEGEKHDDDHGEIILHPEVAERFGIETETVAIAPFHDVIKVTGTVVPSTGRAGIIAAPTAGIITFARGIERGYRVANGTLIATVRSTGITGGDVNMAAKANYEASRREIERLKPLYEERLVTASEYNAALRAFEEASAVYSANATTGAVRSTLSGVITSVDVAEGQFVQVGETVATVSSSDKLTLRADVPEKYYQRIQGINDAVIGLPYSGATVTLSSVGGERINDINTATITPGYIPVYFSFNNDGSVLPGVSVETYLLGKVSEDVISVPLSSLSEQQGLLYVFVRLDEECYAKVPVKTGRSDGKRIEIISGLKPGDEVVTAGTTTVRIAESSGVVPEGHTHNH